MPRSLAEWWGATPDTQVPPRVRYRVFLAAKRRCAGPCHRKLRIGARFTCDHIKALINGGENRETNLQILCDWCNPKKNASDVAEKAKVYHQGAKQFAAFRQTTGDPIPGTIASGWKHRMRGGWEKRP